jgi:hypothetical protein
MAEVFLSTLSLSLLTFPLRRPPTPGAIKSTRAMWAQTPHLRLAYLGTKPSA